jgi:hypothetical protein
MQLTPPALALTLTVAILSACSGSDISNTDQQRFLKILDGAADEYADAPNEIKKDEIEAAQKKALCDPTLKLARGWVGKVSELRTISGGLVLSVRVGESYDLEQGGIGKDNPVFEMASVLSKGDVVAFNGQFRTTPEGCIRPRSLVQESRIRSPDFDFTFESITAE